SLGDRRRREPGRGVRRDPCGGGAPGQRNTALSLCARARRGPRGLGGEAVTARRVVLTGRGVVSPLGVGIDAHWDALCAGRSGVARLDRLAALGLPASRGGAVAPDLVQPHLGRLPRKQQKLYNRATLFAMLGAALAMEVAGLQPGAADAQLEELFFATYWGAGLIAADDGDSAGLTAGEGAGLLVLEAAEHARARGAGIHGEITGFAGSAGEGRLASADEPTRLASRLARVIERAIDEAGGGPDVVSLHGDGIPAHDSAEARALTRVLGARAETTPRLRMKQAHADLGAAASPVELLACSAALEHA